ncbi:MAG TPA: helix-turn-helix domain-containing protein [Ktedonobacteraceae bacterium]|nr:helix-turn-helix domain-containing protein [Ktedonobacteraceae bacterium]
MQEEKLLDVQHVAERLDVNPRTVLRMVERGELPAFKVSHRLRFRPADLEKYLQSNLSTAPTSASVDSTPPQNMEEPDNWSDAGVDSRNSHAVNTAITLKDMSSNEDARASRHSKLAAQIKMERQRLEIAQKEVDLHKQLLDLHTRRIDHALDAANRMVSLLPPEIDSSTKTSFIQSLLPGLLLPEHHQAPWLTMFSSQLQTHEDSNTHR